MNSECLPNFKYYYDIDKFRIVPKKFRIESVSRRNESMKFLNFDY